VATALSSKILKKITRKWVLKMTQLGKNTINLKIKTKWRLHLAILKIKICSWYSPSKAMLLYEKLINELNRDVLKFAKLKEVK